MDTSSRFSWFLNQPSSATERFTPNSSTNVGMLLPLQRQKINSMDLLCTSTSRVQATAGKIPKRQNTHLQMGKTMMFTESLGTAYPMVKVGVQESGRKVLVNANASYATPLEPSSGSSFIIRPLAEILRDLNKKVPDQVLKDKPGSAHQKYIPWYHANRMLSFYAPGWCGEVRDITFSADGKFVTVIYRVTIRGSDGEAFREATGTIFTANSQTVDPTQHAEQVAFVRACARFGLGLYLHHGEEQ